VNAAVAPVAGVIVSNPTVLPPPGPQFGWVDRPCATEVRYQADWLLPNGGRFTGTILVANSMVVSDLGAPRMQTDGSDVVTTFSANLDATVTTLEGQVLAHPMVVELPGEMTVRLVGKVGKTTGTFLVTVEALTFSNESFLVKLDPGRRSTGAITVTALGGGSYAVECGVDVYSMFSLSIGDPPQWFPLCPDGNAPTHYELLAASCPPQNALSAAFAVAPAAPANSKAVTFTDLSTGGATSWTWSFGDGTGSSERNPSHVFAAPGIYPVRLLVQNAGAASSRSCCVRVGPLWGHGGPHPRRALHGTPAALPAPRPVPGR
jgi:hypothetical protein